MTVAEVRRDDTRTRILEVALEQIAENGFAATSTRELSERLGFTKAALYYHFRTKDDLLAALVEPMLTGLRALAETGPINPSPAARRAVLAGYLDLVATHQGLIGALSQDPSVKHAHAFDAAAGLHDRLTQRLAGTESPTTAERVRVRAALGAIHFALKGGQADEDQVVVRETTLRAACGALRIPAGRPKRAD